jgi:N-acetylmuramoyl-L-alanine amidase
MPEYDINGTAYLPLITYCERQGINWDYDIVTRTIVLNKGAHKVNMRAGDTLVLVNGKPQKISSPVDIYQGTIVVPYKFKEQVLDNLFVRSAPVSKKPAAVILSRIKKVVVDAGHGGEDAGAKGKTGLREKVVNLDIAKRLAALLKEDGIEVVLTRTTDKFITLPGRVEIANKSNADLFVSIHSNAHRSRNVNGFEVYYIAPRVSDSKRALNAAQNGARLNVDPKCFAGHSESLKAILWDMVYTNSRAESIELARSICKQVDTCDLNIKMLGVKNANFHVLRGARIPAVLVEVGYLTNGTEEQYLKNNYYRQRIAEEIKQGIDNYGRTCVLVRGENR